MRLLRRRINVVFGDIVDYFLALVVHLLLAVRRSRLDFAFARNDLQARLHIGGFKRVLQIRVCDTVALVGVFEDGVHHAHLVP